MILLLCKILVVPLSYRQEVLLVQSDRVTQISSWSNELYIRPDMGFGKVSNENYLQFSASQNLN